MIAAEAPTEGLTTSENGTVTAVRHWPALLFQHQLYGSQGYTGIPRPTWFRLKAMGKTPKPVNLPTGGIMYRKTDIDRWLSTLKAA